MAKPLLSAGLFASESNFYTVDPAEVKRGVGLPEVKAPNRRVQKRDMYIR